MRERARARRARVGLWGCGGVGEGRERVGCARPAGRAGVNITATTFQWTSTVKVYFSVALLA